MTIILIVFPLLTGSVIATLIFTSHQGSIL